MKYYVRKEGGTPKETTRQDYYSKIRRKDARTRTLINNDEIVGREVIIN